MPTNENWGDSTGGRKRVISIVGMLAVIVGLGALGPRPVRAEIQNDLVGFATNHVFESSQAGENINTMNGNMSLTIPIGPRHKLHDSFSYGVTLYYNAKIWEHECPAWPEQTCPGTIVASSAYGLGFSIWPARVYHKPTDKSY